MRRGTGKGDDTPRAHWSPLALTTGQAARYCLVSPDTIVNWIAEGRIRAQRTAGGQFRIRVEDLREFMVAHGMRTDVLRSDLHLEPLCWEFWTTLDAQTRTPGPRCGECPVYRSQATVCHEVRPHLPGGTLRAPSCMDCLYFATMRNSDGDPE